MSEQGEELKQGNTEDGPLDEEAVARRAYEISQSDEAGTPEENWARAERELGEQAMEARAE
jgi:hypothetical protein